MFVRKKLTEMEKVSALVVGLGVFLAVMAFLLASAQSADPKFLPARLDVFMILGALFFVGGIALWLFVTQPWQNFDDWSKPLFTGHNAHPVEQEPEGTVEAETADLATIGVHPVTHHHGQVTVPSGEADRRDDFVRVIDGIGPKIATVLHSVGVRTFSDLASREPQELERIVRDAGVRMVGHTNTWVDQARLAAEGKQAELEEYQHKLRTKPS